MPLYRTLLLILALLAAMALPTLTLAQTPATMSGNIDLAKVPLFPAELPEPGYRAVQAGHLLEFAFQYGASNGVFNQADWQAVTGTWKQGYSLLMSRPADLANPVAGTERTYLTYILEFDSPESAIAVRDVVLRITGAANPTTSGPVIAFSDLAGFSALGVYQQFLVWNTWSIANPDPANPLADPVWSVDTVTRLNQQTADRITAVVPGIGQATLRVSGSDAQWSIAFTYYPVGDYYRVLDGVLLPASGDVAVDPQTTWPGISNLYMSRQILGKGAEGFEYVLEIELAEFATPEQASAWAANPGVVDLPASLIGGLTVIDQIDLGNGTIRQTVQTPEGAKGYRTITVSGTRVQVISLLASGQGQATEGAIDILASAQLACFNAAPNPCAPIPQEQLGLQLNTSGQ